jgi:YD repeat-containing protein
LLGISLPAGYASCRQPDNLSVSATTQNQVSGYGYDQAGNLTSIPGTGETFSYDAENRIASTAGVSYTYDGDGQRVAKSSGTIYW